VTHLFAHIGLTSSERNALPNMYADQSTRLYTIADLSQVWVNAQVFQDDIGR